MPLMEFPQLQRLELVRGDDWIVYAIVAMSGLLRPSIKLQL